jgi:hypothetical protein
MTVAVGCRSLMRRYGFQEMAYAGELWSTNSELGLIGETEAVLMSVRFLNGDSDESMR